MTRGLFYLSIIMLIVSCSSSSTVISNSKLVEDFYVGKEGTQYFIKPIEFISEDKGKLIADFTFRYKDEIKDSVAINFSIYDSQIFKKLETISFESGEVQVTSSVFELLYNEKSKKSQFLSRFSTKISLEELNKLFTSGSVWKLGLKEEDFDKHYSTNKKASRAIDQINTSLFVLMR